MFTNGYAWLDSKAKPRTLADSNGSFFDTLSNNGKRRVGINVIAVCQMATRCNLDIIFYHNAIVRTNTSVPTNANVVAYDQLVFSVVVWHTLLQKQFDTIEYHRVVTHRGEVRQSNTNILANVNFSPRKAIPLYQSNASQLIDSTKSKGVENMS